MTERTKAQIGSIVGVLGLLIALYGLERVYGAAFGSGGAVAMTILLIGVIVGVTGLVVGIYNRARAKRDDASDRLAVETLAKLGRKMGEQAQNTKNTEGQKPPRHTNV